MSRIVVATIAGSDPSGGAGLQTDLRVFSLLGAYGQTVITALTVQNSLGVKRWQAVTPDLVKDQLVALFEDLPPLAIKTGMLANAEIIREVAQGLREYKPMLIIDPVMVAKSGDPLLKKDAEDALVKELLPLATVITPNIPEAEHILGEKITDIPNALEKLKKLGPQAVIIKGGHLSGENATDYLLHEDKVYTFSSPRVEGRVGHGTGCTFSAALTVFLAQGKKLPEAVKLAKDFVFLGLLGAKASPLGKGVSPLDHLVHFERLKEAPHILKELEEAAAYFCSYPVRPLIPEVQTNLGYALPFAQKQEEVAAFPGRIVAFGQGAHPVGCPRFGASRHIANVILAAGKFNHEIRAAMNIRFREEFLEKAQKMGFTVGEFSRADEPREIKEKEGSTLSWGVTEICKKLGFVPDFIADRGEVGKEPMIRILGKDPFEVVKKALKLLEGG
ncbi:bifunctional hydroxymethylpyrimidine kinase/phosphomethylpyrimidine kinase [Thermodesulfatator atlanticus]|uniref:bifunctional hydroxymethylpyrimidine kinase/phosphomethylpyrimidine kinase n=1 Tax=Thermodesulfatator atlanticus TaxID=501497 RepID=UPI0004162035|nr:bifunctional hydroxymethylpyrimidine kinase/phosphomethylpyrimidine kinase [Thermodesulfatator atlanticus]